MDVALELTANGQADIVIDGGDLRVDRGLRTAALVSLFCDARAASDEIPAGENPRGWWAEDPADPWGSKLWLLTREKRTPATLELARGYARTAVAWLAANGIAQRTEVDGAYGPKGELGLTVRPFRGTSRRWNSLWIGETERTAELPGALLRVLPA